MPCRSSRGDPLPPRTPWIDAPSVQSSNSSNPSNMPTNPRPPRLTDRPVLSQLAVRVNDEFLLPLTSQVAGGVGPVGGMITPRSSPLRSAPTFPVLSSGPQQILDKRGSDLHWWPTTPGYPGTGRVTRPVTNGPADHGGSLTK